MNKYKYKRTYYAGSSKGGTAAIYYGVKNNATAVFSGACQYNLGTYLSIDKHRDIFQSMMGGAVLMLIKISLIMSSGTQL